MEAEETAPFFVEPLQESTVKEGEDVLLKCRLNTSKGVEIRWFKDGQPFNPTNVKVEDGTVSLKIEKTSSKVRQQKNRER